MDNRVVGDVLLACREKRLEHRDCDAGDLLLRVRRTHALKVAIERPRSPRAAFLFTGVTVDEADDPGTARGMAAPGSQRRCLPPRASPWTSVPAKQATWKSTRCAYPDCPESRLMSSAPSHAIRVIP